MTRLAEKVLLKLYKAYSDKCKTMPKSEARDFSDEEVDSLFSDVDRGDLQDALAELKAGEYVKLYIDGSCSLKPSAVEYGETALLRSVKKVANVASKTIETFKP